MMSHWSFTVLLLAAGIGIIDGKRCTANCRRCLRRTPSMCQTCERRYFLSAGICRACDDTNCLICSAFKTCTRCYLGYFLTQSDSCESCGDNCYRCTEANNCASCVTGYFKTNGLCQPCTQNCLRCGFWENCLQCTEGYYSDRGRQCEACGTACLRCRDGYWGSACYNRCMSTCYGHTCDQSTGVCLRCHPNCAQGHCDVGGLCSHGCTPGFYSDTCSEPCMDEQCTNSICFQNNGTCIERCSDGCVSCNSTTHCDVCQNGYYGNTCQNDCRTCRYHKCSKERCTFGCKSGYYLDGEICKKCRQTCNECTRYETCTKCVNGRYGIRCQDECDTTKCAACAHSQNNSTKCTSEFILQIGNTCCPVNCAQCDDQASISVQDRSYTSTIVGGCLALIAVVLVALFSIRFCRRRPTLINRGEDSKLQRRKGNTDPSSLSQNIGYHPEQQMLYSNLRIERRGEENADFLQYECVQEANADLSQYGNVQEPNTDLCQYGNVQEPNTDLSQYGNVQELNTDLSQYGNIQEANADTLQYENVQEANADPQYESVQRNFLYKTVTPAGSQYENVVITRRT